MVKKYSQRGIYDAMKIIKEKTKKTLKVFNEAMENVMPILEVKSRELVGKLSVPVEVDPERRVTLAMRWIISYSRSKTGRPFAES